MSNRILVVDDSETVRSLISFILKADGFTVETAINGIDALEHVYKDNYDLIVCDVNMPKMDGLTFIKILRFQDLYREIPIIVVSTEEKEEDKQRGLEAGANVYLIKPTEPTRLLANIHMLLG